MRSPVSKLRCFQTCLSWSHWVARILVGMVLLFLQGVWWHLQSTATSQAIPSNRSDMGPRMARDFSTAKSMQQLTAPIKWSKPQSTNSHDANAKCECFPRFPTRNLNVSKQRSTKCTHRRLSAHKAPMPSPSRWAQAVALAFVGSIQQPATTLEACVGDE